MNRYACDECGPYFSTERDPVRARKVHRLAHLVIDSEPQLQSLEVPAYQIRDYVQRHMGNILAQRQSH
jgi:hypothetical protein